MKNCRRVHFNVSVLRILSRPILCVWPDSPASYPMQVFFQSFNLHFVRGPHCKLFVILVLRRFSLFAKTYKHHMKSFSHKALPLYSSSFLSRLYKNRCFTSWFIWKFAKRLPHILALPTHVYKNGNTISHKTERSRLPFWNTYVW